MNETSKPYTGSPPIHLEEDLNMAQKRSAQLATLVPLLATNFSPALRDLSIELADDLSRALTNLR